MKIYVVSMKGSDRRASILDQFNRYGITDYEFVDAVDGRDLTDHQIESLYDRKAASILFRPLTKGEIGCALSHLAIYQRILEDPSDKRSLIIEDDALLQDVWANIKNNESHNQNIDLIMFGCHTSNVNDAEQQDQKTYAYQLMGLKYIHRGIQCRCYFTAETIDEFGLTFNRLDDRSYRIDYLHGTHAYSPSKEACRKLIQSNTPVKMPADMPWCMQEYSIYGMLDDAIKINFDFESVIAPDRAVYDQSPFGRIFNARVQSEEFGR